jgi:FkbM family methyltransferase
MTEPFPFGAFAPTPARARLMAIAAGMGQGWLGRRIAFGVRRLARRGLQGPVDAERFGARFRLQPHGNVAEKRILFTPQYFDPQERAILAAQVKPDWVFIDIGANIGAYSLIVAALGAGRVIAVEPQPGVLARLRANIGFNPHLPVAVEPLALCDREGVIRLAIDARNEGEASIVKAGGEGVEVACSTLVALCARHGLNRIDALKIDVEGAEELVLRPFFAAAPRSLWPRLVILERGEKAWAGDLLGDLLALGYRRLAETRMNHVLQLAAA